MRIWIDFLNEGVKLERRVEIKEEIRGFMSSWLAHPVRFMALIIEL